MKCVFLVVVLLPFLYACKDCTSKKVNCPGYQEPAANWFPYTVNQRLIFRNNGINDTITLGTITASGPSQINVSASNPWCTAYKQWSSNEYSLPGTYKFSMVASQQSDAYQGSGSQQSWSLNLHRSGFSGNGISDTGIIKTPSNSQRSQYYPFESVGGTTYPMVQMIMSDTTVLKSPRIYKLWLAKNNGIIAYEEYPSLKLWIKQ